MKTHLGNPRHGTKHNILDTRLRCRSHSNRVAVAPQTRGDPEHIDFRDRLRSLRTASNHRSVSHSRSAPKDLKIRSGPLTEVGPTAYSTEIPHSRKVNLRAEKPAQRRTALVLTRRHPRLPSKQVEGAENIPDRSHRTDSDIPPDIFERHQKDVSCKNQASSSHYISSYPKCVHRAPFHLIHSLASMPLFCERFSSAMAA